MDPRAAKTAAPPPSAASLGTIAPIIAFLVANRLGGLRWAVGAATLTSAATVIDRRRRNLPLGRFMPALTAAIIARGAIGILTDSEAVYFGLGIAGKLGFGLILIGSTLAGHPLAARIAHLALETTERVRRHPEWHRAMGVVTAIGGLYYLCSGAIDVFLYRRSSVEGYVILRFVANWPLSIVALGAAGAMMQHHLRRIEHAPTLIDMLEARIATLQPPPTRPTTDTETQ